MAGMRPQPGAVRRGSARTAFRLVAGLLVLAPGVVARAAAARVRTPALPGRDRTVARGERWCLAVAVGVLCALSALDCASVRPLPVASGNRIVSAVTDPVGDGARFRDAELEPAQGPDLVEAEAVLELSPAEGEPRLLLSVRCAPPSAALFNARFVFDIDLDSTPVTPSYAAGKGVRVDIEPAGPAFVARGLFRVGGALPVVATPPWGTGHAGEDGIAVGIPLSWLARRTAAVPQMGIPGRTWKEWLGHEGRPLRFRVFASTRERWNEQSDALPDLDQPPAILPVPRL